MTDSEKLKHGEEKSSGDLIERCEECNWCPFEIVLTDIQRRRGVLDKPVMGEHPHRDAIEQVCGQEYDGVCNMKYAAMRAKVSEYHLIQFGDVISVYRQDCSTGEGREVTPDEAFITWSKNRFAGEPDNSYAARFRTVWNLGLRPNGDKGTKQSMSGISLYDSTVTNDYIGEIARLSRLRIEAERRHKEGLSLNI